MAYIRPNQGMGDIVPIPLSGWGLVGSPCTLGAPAVIGGDTRCGDVALSQTSAAPGNPCAPASTFPFFGTADASGNCQPASMAMGFAALGVVGVLLFGLFRGGK